MESWLFEMPRVFGMPIGYLENTNAPRWPMPPFALRRMDKGEWIEKWWTGVWA